MSVITIPKKLRQKEDLVVIPKSDYKEFLELKKVIQIDKPTTAEIRVIKRGRREIKKGKYVEWEKLKQELESNSN